MTSEPRKLPQLSLDTVETLKNLRQTDVDKFHLTVSSLCKNGWPLRATADPLNVSRSIVDIWKNKGLKQVAEGATLPVTEGIPEGMPKEIKAVYSKYEVSQEEQEELSRLTEQAKHVRRFTDPNSPSRDAAKELEAKLRYHKDQGASYTQLARWCNRSRRAIIQRLEKPFDE